MNTACVFCIDDAYVMPFQVFFHSLETTESIPEETQVFILHAETLSARSITDLKKFLSRYSRSAHFVNIQDCVPSDLPIKEDDHVSLATYYRLLAGLVLPTNIDYAVYLDVDMLAMRSARQLFTHKPGSLLAATDHCSPYNSIRLWGDAGGSYFQAGAIVIPLNKWRQQRIEDKFIDTMRTKRDAILWWDQDVLNLAIGTEWDRLPVWLNVTKEVIEAVPWEQVLEKAALIHYTGASKPWNAYDAGPFTSQWDQGFEATFGYPFHRHRLKPSLVVQIRKAIKSRLSGLVHGRY